MILSRLGWNHAQILSVQRTLAASCQIGVRAELHTRGGDFVRRVGVDGGQVDVSPDQGRTMRADLNDDEGQLSSIPQERFLTYNIAVWHQVLDDNYGLCEYPVFNGPIVKADPGDGLVGVNARGKADLAHNNLLERKVFHKGHLVTNAITTALHDWSGLRLSDITLPTLKHTLPKDMRAARGDLVWAQVVKLAEGVGMDIIFDGAGKTLMREQPTVHHFTFYDKTIGDRNDAPATVTSLPQRAQTLRDENGDYLPNWVIVNGNKVSRGHPGLPHVTTEVTGEAFANPRSTISAQKQAVNGVPQYHLQEVTNETIKTYDTAHRIAKTLVDRYDQVSQEVSFDALALGFFDFNDRVAVHTEHFFSAFNLRTFSFPLGGDGDSAEMTVGYKRRLSLAGAKVRVQR